MPLYGLVEPLWGSQVTSRAFTRPASKGAFPGHNLGTLSRAQCALQARPEA